MVARDSIDDYFSVPEFTKNMPKELVITYVARAHHRCPLDYTEDEPLPEWAQKILTRSGLPMKAKLKILEWHGKKIGVYRGIKDERLKAKLKKVQRKHDISPVEMSEKEKQELADARGFI